MNNKKLLGSKIKELRKLKGYTQESLAEKIGIETNSLSAIESGRHFPSLLTLEKISQNLGVRLRSFFEFYDETETKKMKEKIIHNLNYLEPKDVAWVCRYTEHHKYLH